MISTYFSIKIIKCVFSRVLLFNVEYAYFAFLGEASWTLVEKFRPAFRTVFGRASKGLTVHWKATGRILGALKGP